MLELLKSIKARVIKFLASGNSTNGSASEGSGGRESTEWKWESDLHVSHYSFLESLLRNIQLLFRSLSFISVSKQEDSFLWPEEVNVAHAWKIDWEYLADVVTAIISLKLIHLMLSTLVEEQTFLQAFFFIF